MKIEVSTIEGEIAMLERQIQQNLGALSVLRNLKRHLETPEPEEKSGEQNG